MRLADVAKELKLASPSNIGRYENGELNINAKQVSGVINLYAQHLTTEELNQFVNELFDIRIEVTATKENNPEYVKLLVKYSNLLEKHAKLKDVLSEHIKNGCPIDPIILF